MDRVRTSDLPFLDADPGPASETADAPLRPETFRGFCLALLAPLALLVAAAMALPLDLPLAQWCVGGHNKYWLGLNRFFSPAETYGHGIGLVFVILAIYLLDPRRRWALVRLAAIALGAGLMADVVKLLVLRTRPHDFKFHGGVWNTFGGWLPLWHGLSGQQSMPSGHTALAVGLTLGLAWLYPRFRWLFFGMAALVACQRITSGAHYLSDTLVGASLGFLSAAIFLKEPRAVSLLCRLENWLGHPPPDMYPSSVVNSKK
jgi:membrane-associated phospholipid phosphatase